MKIDCPKCATEMDLDNYEMPNHSCDCIQVECENEDCDEEFNVGWYATAELR